MLATNGVTAFQIMPIVWKAICYLEKINLKVIGATAGGTLTNRKVFKMHKPLDGNVATDVVHRTKNIHTQENRFFFSDTPHLIKTHRNGLFNSGSGRCTRYMWNSGIFLLWSHI